MNIEKYKTIQGINFYIETNPISKTYQRILFKDNDWNYTYKNNFDNKDINSIRFFTLNSNIVQY
tara:strand:+ start:143 stop:334 length:192 start_codon:yes stop_codon:yes gene_type:complete